MKIEIIGEFIKLGQLLKKIGIIDTGGRAKNFLENHEVAINNRKDVKRNSKVKPSDKVWVDGEVYYIVSSEAE